MSYPNTNYSTTDSSYPAQSYGYPDGTQAQNQGYYYEGQSSTNAAYYDQNYSYPSYAAPPIIVQPSDIPVASIPLGYDSGMYIPPEDNKQRKTRQKKTLRVAAGKVWEDRTLLEWDQNDFRLFAGDLGPEVTEDILKKAFEKYPSFKKAKVIKDKRTERSKFGFISFGDSGDFVKAWKEMNGKFVGSRPVKLRKSTWKDRAIDQSDKRKSKKDR